MPAETRWRLGLAMLTDDSDFGPNYGTRVPPELVRCIQIEHAATARTLARKDCLGASVVTPEAYDRLAKTEARLYALFP